MIFAASAHVDPAIPQPADTNLDRSRTSFWRSDKVATHEWKRLSDNQPPSTPRRLNCPCVAAPLPVVGASVFWTAGIIVPLTEWPKPTDASWCYYGATTRSKPPS